MTQPHAPRPALFPLIVGLAGILGPIVGAHAQAAQSSPSQDMSPASAPRDGARPTAAALGYQPVNPAASVVPLPPPPPAAPPVTAVAQPAGPPATATRAKGRPTPGDILAAAPADAWRRVAADRLLVMELAGGGQVLIELAPEFAPEHVANIVTLAQSHWFDGIAIVRLQENYVVQWGDPTEKKPLPADLPGTLPAEYDRSAAGLALFALPYRDAYASTVGYAGDMPVAIDEGRAWLTHCYSMVGVGRNNAPDTGTGAELYAVIGQAPRALDRNITVVGRVIAGMEAMTGRPRGTAALGFYTDPAQREPIASVRLAADLPEAQRPAIEVLRTDTPTFTAWMQARANRQDSFFVHPAGAIDLCNALPPVRKAPIAR